MAGDVVPIDKATPKPALFELGTTGLKQFSGRINEEFLTELRGLRGERTLKEMAENDSTVSAILFAIEMLLRNIPWRVDAASTSQEDRDAAEFLQGCMEDMSHTWADFISEVLTMLQWGWSFFEIVYKVRDGDSLSSEHRSRYNDGKIGWRKFAPRAQETRKRWLFDQTGGVQAFVQMLPYAYEAVIPIDKGLLFRTTSRKNSPEGKSAIRGAYRAWYMKKRIEEIEGVGIERDLAGFPILYAPSVLMSSTNAAEQAQYTELKNIVRNVRRDEQEGMILPSDTDERGNRMYEMKLLSTGGRRQFDTTKIIDRWDRRIAASVLADFIMLGQDKAGSFALSSDKTAIFQQAIDGWNTSIASVLNRHAVPRLMGFNGYNLEVLPQLKPASVTKDDMHQFADALWRLAGAGFALAGDVSVENLVRDKMGLPPVDEATLNVARLTNDISSTQGDEERGDGPGGDGIAPNLPPGLKKLLDQVERRKA
jgi:phage gp29-like protein